MSKINQEDFSLEVEVLAQNSDLTYLEALMSKTEEHSVDLGTVKNMISKPLLEKLELEGVENRTLKNSEKGNVTKIDNWF